MAQPLTIGVHTSWQKTACNFNGFTVIRQLAYGSRHDYTTKLVMGRNVRSTKKAHRKGVEGNANH